MPKLVLKDIPQYQKYQNAWDLVKAFLIDTA